MSVSGADGFVSIILVVEVVITPSVLIVAVIGFETGCGNNVC